MKILIGIGRTCFTIGSAIGYAIGYAFSIRGSCEEISEIKLSKRDIQAVLRMADVISG